MVERLELAATASNNRFMITSVDALRELNESDPYVALDQRRGMDYHRRRPQSVEHVSPRSGVTQHYQTYTTLTMPAPCLEMEADADKVHEIAADAMEQLRVTMRTVRLLLPKAIRRERVTYVFG
jgi:hypothetical protein